MKRIISFCLATVLLLTAVFGLQLTASAKMAKSGECGYGGKNPATYTFDSATGLLTISGKGAIASEAFFIRKK